MKGKRIRGGRARFEAADATTRPDERIDDFLVFELCLMGDR